VDSLFKKKQSKILNHGHPVAFTFRDTPRPQVVQCIRFPNHELLVVTHWIGEETDCLEKDMCSAGSNMDPTDRQEIHRKS
jgi:hypothetical protein